MDNITDLENIYLTAYSPVNVVTIILEETKESYTFILHPYKPSSSLGLSDDEYKTRYSLYEKQLKDHNDLMNNLNSFIKDLHDSFDDVYGNIKYSIREYEKEIELIADVFRLINLKKPNFCMIWNMRFDIQYLLERIKVLGYDPKSIMCHPDFKNPNCYFHIDKMTFRIEKQYDYFYCSSYTQFICQMRLYGSSRKSQQMLKSISLNAIADRELKDRKVEYPFATNIRSFPYDDWKLFIKYNIKDSLLQMGIERKTNDLISYYIKSHSNLTPYSKVFKETHLLRNVREQYFEQQNWIQSNNLNIIDNEGSDNLWEETDTPSEDDDEDTSFKGAIMADPIWNDKVGVVILGSPSNIIYVNLMDYDAVAFYPSCKTASNMDPSTLIAKATINNEDFISGECQNRSLCITYKEKDKYGKVRNIDISGEVVNIYLSENILTFCYDFLSLPSITELYRDIMKQYEK
jgi:hypothetical protein